MNQTLTATLQSLNVPYVVAEVLVAIMAVVGNLLVLVAFAKEKRLRRLTNYYIVSLAVADCLVGLLGVPFAVLTSLGLPHQFHACVFMLSVLVVMCTISIFNLVAVSVDRFWAILFPLNYARLMSGRAARWIIVVCWILGAVVGFLPMAGWHNNPPADEKCEFTRVMDYYFLVFLYFSTIVLPSILMGGFYARIYCVVVKQFHCEALRSCNKMRVRQISSLERGQSSVGIGMRTVNRRDVKAAKNLFLIVIFFVFCWMPLYTINCVQAFCKQCVVPQELMDFTIILSHVNSAGNPILYACHLRDFRDAMRRLLCGKRPLNASQTNGSIPSLAQNVASCKSQTPRSRSPSVEGTPVQLLAVKR